MTQKGGGGEGPGEVCSGEGYGVVSRCRGGLIGE